MGMRVFVEGFGERDCAPGVSGLELVRELLPEKYDAVVFVKVDGQPWDLSRIIPDVCRVEFFDFSQVESLEVLRHSAAHIMAQGIKRLYPDVRYAAGPTVENGFYYDMCMQKALSEEDFGRIEDEVEKIVAEQYPFMRSEMPVDEALDYFREREDLFKVEFLRRFREEGIQTVSLYQQGEFVDLCRGPHICHSGQLKAFRLMKLSGAYWQGDSQKAQLQRVYGTAFFASTDLQNYLDSLEEAKRRDHRKLGKDLTLFYFDPSSPGFPIWQPHGLVLYNLILDFIRKENTSRGYQEVKTPVLFDESLWHKSGHIQHFQENMYFTSVDKKNFALKPMNCPGHCVIYKSSLRSYRELPVKFAEFGLVHRNELSGVLHGLFRLRAFTQDDAHVFCSEAGLQEEIMHMIDYTLYVYRIMGFQDYTISIATRPENAVGSARIWAESTRTLESSLEAKGLNYSFKEGEGAFYGPKIEFNIEDSLSRNWQCGTIQVDFSMPQRLSLTYEGTDGNKHTPVMIHRAILGSLERFIGIILEHYAGRLPVWLSPIQVQLTGIHDRHAPYIHKIETRLLQAGIRVKKDLTNEKLGYKIRKAQLSQIPYIAVIGDKEAATQSLSIRKREAKELFKTSLEAFIEQVYKESIY